MVVGKIIKPAAVRGVFMLKEIYGPSDKLAIISAISCGEISLKNWIFKPIIDAIALNLSSKQLKIT